MLELEKKKLEEEIRRTKESQEAKREPAMIGFPKRGLSVNRGIGIHNTWDGPAPKHPPAPKPPPPKAGPTPDIRDLQRLMLQEAEQVMERAHPKPLQVQRLRQQNMGMM